MQEAADAGDPDYKRVLEGTNNDPVKVIENVRFAGRNETCLLRCFVDSGRHSELLDRCHVVLWAEARDMRLLPVDRSTRR